MTAIALVEDNPDNRLLIRVLVGHLYELHEYVSGEQALEAFARNPPDLVLLDISLPGMSGVDVLRNIRGDERLSPLPVIALSAHAEAGESADYIAAGFDEYVTKPILDHTILLRAIDDGLTRTRR